MGRAGERCDICACDVSESRLHYEFCACYTCGQMNTNGGKCAGFLDAKCAGREPEAKMVAKVKARTIEIVKELAVLRRDARQRQQQQRREKK